MQKFTVFTVLLTVVVVVIAAEVFVNDYLPDLIGEKPSDEYELPGKLDLSASLSANVFDSDGGSANGGGYIPSGGGDVRGEIVTRDPLFDQSSLESLIVNNKDLLVDDFGDVPSGNTDVSFDIEDFSGSYDRVTTRVYLTNDNIVNSGFTGGYLEPQDYDGFVYKTISLGDLYGLSVSKYSITNGQTIYSKAYAIVPQDVSTAGEIYSVMKVRAAEGLEVDVNETNTHGDASFYMNDVRRQHVAFLTVRKGGLIYAFAYPKDYHDQISALVKSL